MNCIYCAGECECYLDLDDEADDFLGPMNNDASNSILGVIKRDWGCKDPKCSCSTGICESLTFGKGRLDVYGYWEFPCWECARAWEEKYPGDNCWPFPDRDLTFA